MSDKEISNGGYIWVLCVGIFIGFFLYQITEDKGISPVLKNGVDTLMYKDSAYVIHFKIDTAIYIDPNPDGEPLPDPRY